MSAQGFETIDPGKSFALIPEQASTLAGQVDAVFFGMLFLCGTTLLIVLVLMIDFIVRYRKGNPHADRTHRWPERIKRRIEWVWITIPLLIFLAVFVWGGLVFIKLYSVPAEGLEIHAIAKQWMWEFQH